jgi:hypothetical protein
MYNGESHARGKIIRGSEGKGVWLEAINWGLDSEWLTPCVAFKSRGTWSGIPSETKQPVLD